MACKGRFFRAAVFLAVTVLLCAGVLSFAYRQFYRSAYPLRYKSAVSAGSAEYGLPESLIYAIIRTESGFRPHVRSSAGAVGLMQITADTFAWTQYRLGEEKRPLEVILDGDTNIRYGSALLRFLIDEFDTLENALCAYHAGWGSAKKWLADPAHSADGMNIERIPFEDTEKYVKKVLETKAIYEKLYRMNV